MLRKRLVSESYTPQWEGFIEGFVTNFLRKNYWRVASCMEYEDAMQEAKLVFVKLQNKYKVNSPKHFMALYKTTLVREFNDLATMATEIRNEALTFEYKDFIGDEQSVQTVVGDTECDGMLAIMIEQAPREIKQVLNLFLNTPVEVLDQFSMVWKWNKRNSDFGNRHICEILGFREGTDVVKKLREYFQ